MELVDAQKRDEPDAAGTTVLHLAPGGSTA